MVYHFIFSNFRYLNKLGLSSHRAARVPMLTKKHMAVRMKFATKMMTYDWQKVWERDWYSFCFNVLHFSSDSVTKNAFAFGRMAPFGFGGGKEKGFGKVSHGGQ